MDTELALTNVRECLTLLDASLNLYQHPNPAHFDRQLEDALKKKLPLIEAIEDAIRPAQTPLQRSYDPGRWPWFSVRKRLLALEGTLDSQEELHRILDPQGPKLNAIRLHPWVWDAAASAWNDGHRRGAIQAAATSIDQQLKAKLNRFDISGTDLAGQAFSPSPPQDGRSRLRMPGHPQESPEFRSRQLGALHFAQGCMEGIRNIARPTSPTSPTSNLRLNSSQP